MEIIRSIKLLGVWGLVVKFSKIMKFVIDGTNWSELDSRKYYWRVLWDCRVLRAKLVPSRGDKPELIGERARLNPLKNALLKFRVILLLKWKITKF